MKKSFIPSLHQDEDGGDIDSSGSEDLSVLQEKLEKQENYIRQLKVVIQDAEGITAEMSESEKPVSEEEIEAAIGAGEEHEMPRQSDEEFMKAQVNLAKHDMTHFISYWFDPLQFFHIVTLNFFSDKSNPKQRFVKYPMPDFNKFEEDNPSAPSGFDAWYHQVFCEHTEPGKWPLPKGCTKKLENCDMNYLSWAFVRWLFLFAPDVSWQYFYYVTYSSIVNGLMPWFLGRIAGLVADIYERRVIIGDQLHLVESDQEDAVNKIWMYVLVMVVLQLIRLPFWIRAETLYPGQSKRFLLRYVCFGRMLSKRPLPMHGIAMSLDENFENIWKHVFFPFFNLIELVLTSLVLIIVLFSTTQSDADTAFGNFCFMYIIPFGTFIILTHFYHHRLHFCLVPFFRMSEHWQGIQKTYVVCALSARCKAEEENKGQDDHFHLDDAVTDYWHICKTRWQFDFSAWAAAFCPTELVQNLFWLLETLIRVVGAYLVWKEDMTFVEYVTVMSAISYLNASLMPMTVYNLQKSKGYEALYNTAAVLNHSHTTCKYDLDSKTLAHLLDLKHCDENNITKGQLKRLKKVDFHGLAKHMTHHNAQIIHRLKIPLKFIHGLAAECHHADGHDYMTLGVPQKDEHHEKSDDDNEKVDFQELRRQATAFRERTGASNDWPGMTHASGKLKRMHTKLHERKLAKK